MTEEAREAALHEDYIAAAIRLMEVGSGLRARGVHVNDTPVTVEPWRFLEIVKSAKAAGVREGIRQAREAVAGEDLFDNTGDDFDGAYKAAIDDALRAIDALEAEK